MVRFSDRLHMQSFRLLGLCLALCSLLWTCVPMASAFDEDLIHDTSSEFASEAQVEDGNVPGYRQVACLLHRGMSSERDLGNGE